MLGAGFVACGAGRPAEEQKKTGRAVQHVGRQHCLGGGGEFRAGAEARINFGQRLGCF